LKDIEEGFENEDFEVELEQLPINK